VSVFWTSYDGARSSKTPLLCFQFAKSPAVLGSGLLPRAGFAVQTATMRSGSRGTMGELSPDCASFGCKFGNDQRSSESLRSAGDVWLKILGEHKLGPVILRHVALLSTDGPSAYVRRRKIQKRAPARLAPLATGKTLETTNSIPLSLRHHFPSSHLFRSAQSTKSGPRNYQTLQGKLRQLPRS